MKKNLILGIAMAMGVTATAFANANPFSDVPAGHWAYDAVAQLQAAGVVEGYGTTFGGEKLATRYEMAQIVAKAMAKGANVEKLAAEFADELDSLGVRVTKLEKKSDNVKITGSVRLSYKGFGGDYKGSGNGHYGRMRTRLFVNGTVNDDWTYVSMIQNDRSMVSQDNQGNTVDNNKVTLNRAYLNGRLGGIKTSFGRMYFADSSMLDATADAVTAGYRFGVVNATGAIMRNVEDPYITGSKAMTDRDRIYMAGVDTKVGVWRPAVKYWVADCTYNTNPVHTNIWQIGTDVELAKGLTLVGNYFRSTTKDAVAEDRTGWELGAKAYGAKAAVKNSCGFGVKYMDRPMTTMIKPTFLSEYAYGHVSPDHADSKYSWLGAQNGVKGWELYADWTVAKNIIASAKYYDLKGRKGEQSRVKTYWASVNFLF